MEYNSYGKVDAKRIMDSHDSPCVGFFYEEEKSRMTYLEDRQETELEAGIVGRVVYGNEGYVWSGNRPNFTDVAYTALPTGEQVRDRCHSVSWETLVAITLDILNYGWKMDERQKYEAEYGINFLTNTMIGLKYFYEDEELIEDGDMYEEGLLIASRELQRAYRKQENVDIRATSYLRTLNSCIYNLRYEERPEYHWNRSVQGAYDPRKWCFVNETLQVVNDETGRLGTPVSVTNYSAFDGKPEVTQSGFYLTHQFDGFLLRRLWDQRITDLLDSVKIYIYHGLDAEGNAVMASSSNEFPTGEYKFDDYSTHFECEGAWQEF